MADALEQLIGPQSSSDDDVAGDAGENGAALLSASQTNSEVGPVDCDATVNLMKKYIITKIIYGSGDLVEV